MTCLNCKHKCYGNQCDECYSDPKQAARNLLHRINAVAESDILAGNPITGAHRRAIELVLKELE